MADDAPIQTASKGKPVKKTNKKPIWSVAALIIGCSALVAFFYFDRNNSVTTMIQSFGASGVIGAVLMMALMCLTPFPSEGLLIMFLKIYGMFWGLLYSCTGFILGSIVVYAIARSIGIKAIHFWTFGSIRINAIDTWIMRKGTVGLVQVRLLPIPAFVVNVLTGILPSMSFWKYLWTGIVGTIPYYIGVSFIFFGTSRRDALALVIGIPILIILWLVAYRLRQHRQ